MVLIAAVDQVVVSLPENVPCGSFQTGIFDIGQLADETVGVDDLPGFGCGEGGAVRGEAGDGAIFLVEFAELEEPDAPEDVVDVGSVRAGVEFGAEDFGEGMEVC